MVGAGASGLAAAAALRRGGHTPLVLDRGSRIGESWALRYDRLHLHTIRQLSSLPGLALPRDLPRYVSKDVYASYLGDYARCFELDVRLEVDVRSVRPSADGRWLVATTDETYTTRAVVVATGRHNEPWLPQWPGSRDFQGRIVHSAEYRSGKEYHGQVVVVAGLGNSGAEIAVDLVEQGAKSVVVAVRSRPPITTREIGGIPVQLLGIALHPLPARLVDGVGRVLRRRATGDLRRFGLGEEEWGPFAERRPAVIDVGFLGVLRSRAVNVVPAVSSFEPRSVVTVDGTRHPADVVVAATGFRTALERLVGAYLLDDRGYPRHDGPAGLFFYGYTETPRGQLFEARRGARALARAVDQHLASPGAGGQPKLAT